MKFTFKLYRATSKSKDVPRSQKLILNSNDRMHFHQKAQIVSKLRQLAKCEVENIILLDFGDENNNVNVKNHFSENNPCGVTLTVFTPTNRRSDPDNLQPTLKAIMDGFTEASLWTDDNHHVVKYTKYQFGGLSGTKAYRLEVDVEEII